MQSGMRRPDPSFYLNNKNNNNKDLEYVNLKYRKIGKNKEGKEIWMRTGNNYDKRRKQ